MKYLSVCSGIEAASVAFKPLGWTPLAFSEIEAFPRAVLAHHYPDVPCHGDFTELKAQPWIVDADLLCGGTPCQSFSVAGLRQSLSDGRGNLSLEFILLANAIDALRSTAGRQPAWILWENVPGVLSTKDNAFGAFLGGLCGRDAAIPEPEGGWTCAGVVDGPTRVAAWRTLDAQFFGVAQRRKRVFVLAKGGAGRWAAADALLPIIESRSWHPAPSRSSRKGVAPTISARPTGGGGLGTDFDCDVGLIAHTLKGEGFDASEDGTGRGVPLVPTWWDGDDVAATLTANNAGGEQRMPDKDNFGAILQPMLVRMREGKEGGGKGPLVSDDMSLTLATGNDQVLCASLALRTREGVVSAELGEPGVANALRGSDGGRAGEGAGAVLNGMQVRRLTPRECERLQGFPDDYTLIPMGKRNKAAEEEEMRQYLRLTRQQWEDYKWSADGPRYKALGNSWAVPVVNWIGRRIEQVNEILSNQQPRT